MAGQSTSVSKIPRLHSRFVRSDFRNGRSLRQSSPNFVRSVERECGRFSEIENRNILDRHHPLNEIKVSSSVSKMVGIWRSTSRSSQVSMSVGKSGSSPLGRHEADGWQVAQRPRSNSRSIRAASCEASGQQPRSVRAEAGNVS